MKPRSEAGFSLVALLASVTIMLILMAAAVPGWRYVMKNEREEELIFRGGQIADAVQRYQKKNGGALPGSLDVLVKGKFLRQAYKDPMTPGGKWRFLRQGEAGVGAGPSGNPKRGTGPAGGAVPSPSPGAGLGPLSTPGGTLGASSGGGSTVGVFVGVASLNKDPSLRVFNGKTHYNEWLFVAGQQRVVGKQLVNIQPPKGGGVPGGAPIGSPVGSPLGQPMATPAPSPSPEQ